MYINFVQLSINLRYHKKLNTLLVMVLYSLVGCVLQQLTLIMIKKKYKIIQYS